MVNCKKTEILTVFLDFEFKSYFEVHFKLFRQNHVIKHVMTSHVMLKNTWLQLCLFRNKNVVTIQPVMYCILKLHFCDVNLF